MVIWVETRMHKYAYMSPVLLFVTDTEKSTEINYNHGSSWNNIIYWAYQEIPCILQKRILIDHNHKHLWLHPTLPTWIHSTQLHNPYLTPKSSKCLFHIFKPHISVYVFSSACLLCVPPTSYFFHLITLIMCRKEDKLWHASLCHFLQLLVGSHLSQAPYSHTPSVYSTITGTRPSSYKTTCIMRVDLCNTHIKSWYYQTDIEAPGCIKV
jgi:hypothetical protein